MTCRFSCCARQRCSFVSGIAVRGTTTRADVALGSLAAAMGGLVADMGVTVAGSFVGTIWVLDRAGVIDAGDVSLGTLFAVGNRDVVTAGRGNACVSGCEVVLTCSGRPQLTIKTNISTNHRRRTTSHVDIRTFVLNLCPVVYHEATAMSSK